jgi:tRNA pseudouridine38-40 synthase
MRVALGLEYDGRPFCGWQTQSSGCGVQDALRQALSIVAGEAAEPVAAGRTDTGVHATGQVLHFDTNASRPMTAWVRGVNAHLPDSVAVIWAREVAPDFHARFSARSRSYRYVLLNHPVRPALDSGRAGWFHQPLDAAVMAEAARKLLGEHDFSAFRAAECQARSPVRTLIRADVAREGERILFGFQANAFLHHMVRNLVGALVYVGAGRQKPEWIDELLAARDRSLAAPTFSPDGLYLTEVEYGAEWELPQAEPRFGL